MARTVESPNVDRLIAKQIALWEAKRKAAQELAEQQPEPEPKPLCGPFVALSRQEGSLGGFVAQDVAKALGWPLFGKELIEPMARRARVRDSLIGSLDEHARHGIEDWLGSLLHHEGVDHYRYRKNLASVLLALGHHGRAVLLGRGATFVLPQESGLNVRVVAPLEVRIANLAEHLELDKAKARAMVRRVDADRRRFGEVHFSRNADDPEHYDLTLNTGMLKVADCVDLIVAAAKRKLGLA